MLFIFLCFCHEKCPLYGKHFHCLQILNTLLLLLLLVVLLHRPILRTPVGFTEVEGGLLGRGNWGMLVMMILGYGDPIFRHWLLMNVQSLCRVPLICMLISGRVLSRLTTVTFVTVPSPPPCHCRCRSLSLNKTGLTLICRLELTGIF